MSHDRAPEPDTACAVLHYDHQGNAIPCPGHGLHQVRDVPCPRWSREEGHDAHGWSAPVDGPSHCPGYGKPDDGVKESAPPQTAEQQVRDLEYVIQRAREALGTDMPVTSPGQPNADIVQLVLAATGIDLASSSTPPDYPDLLATACRMVIQSEAARDKVRRDRGEARQWARHGYEIGQRHCGWTDHGVAPAWLTEGWPRHFDSCEHLKQAADFDTALTRVQALPEQPEVMDAQQPHPDAYLHGYGVAIRDAKRAARTNPPERTVAADEPEGPPA